MKAGCALLACALLSLFFLPTAWMFKSPGTVSDGWLICLSLTLIGFMGNIIYLLANISSSIGKRILGYITMAVFIGVALDLSVAAAEQAEYDLWAHRGISYFPSEAPETGFHVRTQTKRHR